MASDQVVDGFLQAIQREAVKVYCIYDGAARLITSYETVANQVDNGVALVTTYTYFAATNQVVKMKESLGVWSAAYDI